MSVREELIKAIEALDEESLEAVLDYVRLLQEPEEVEPLAEERAAIARGREEFARGECAKWRELKRNGDV